jgi:hypothetical protein
MNALQEDKHSMHLTSKRCLEDNVAKMTSFGKYAELKAGVDNYLTATSKIIQEQEKDRSGVATNKEVLRNTMVDLTMNISTCVVSYATIEKKPELLAEARITDSNLRKETDTKVKEKAELISRIGNENKEKLEGYGLAADDLTKLAVAITLYFAAIPKPTLTIGERAKLTAQLKMNQRATDELFNSIDKLVATQERRDPDFYAQYFNARKIKRTGNRIRAFEILVKNAETGELLPRAKVTLKKRGGSELTKSVKFTGPKGRIYIQTLEPDEYDFTVELGGFEKVSLSFIQNEGIVTKIVIELKSIEGQNPV